MQKGLKYDGKYWKYALKIASKQNSCIFGVSLEANMVKSSFKMRTSSLWPIDLKPSLYRPFSMTTILLLFGGILKYCYTNENFRKPIPKIHSNSVTVANVYLVYGFLEEF